MKIRLYSTSIILSILFVTYGVDGAEPKGSLGEEQKQPQTGKSAEDLRFNVKPPAKSDFQAAQSLIPGLWQGTTKSTHLYLSVSFRVDPVKAIVTDISNENGVNETGRVSWWPSHGAQPATAEIGKDGSFAYTDAHGNYVKGRFKSNGYAEGTVSQLPIKIACPDGMARFPPIEWRAGPEKTVKEK